MFAEKKPMNAAKKPGHSRDISQGTLAAIMDASRTKIALIDGKRSSNVEIAIRRFRMSGTLRCTNYR
jgi:plasmid maintenance system antidote protein VapI